MIKASNKLFIVLINVLCAITFLMLFFGLDIKSTNIISANVEDNNLTVLYENWSNNFPANGVIINSFNTSKKIAFIKAVKQFTGLGLKESKEFSENLPGEILFNEKTDEEITEFLSVLDSVDADYDNNYTKANIEKIIFHLEPLELQLTDDIATYVVGTNNLLAISDESNTIHIYTQNGETIYAPANSANLFSNLTYLEYIDFSNFNTSLVTNMSGMFKNSTKIENLDLSNFETSNVTDMSYMFSGLENILNYSISNFNTSQVEDLSYMFENNLSITNLNINNFNTELVQSFEGVFKNCESITNINIYNWNYSSSNSFKDFLLNCNNLESIQINTNTLGNNVIVLPKSYYCGNELLSVISTNDSEFGNTYFMASCLPQNWLIL